MSAELACAAGICCTVVAGFLVFVIWRMEVNARRDAQEALAELDKCEVTAGLEAFR